MHRPRVLFNVIPMLDVVVCKSITTSTFGLAFSSYNNDDDDDDDDAFLTTLTFGPMSESISYARIVSYGGSCCRKSSFDKLLLL